MTDYQMNLTIDTYFNTLIEEEISEKDVEDINQKNGVLYITLKNEKKIEKKIKNFNN